VLCGSEELFRAPPSGSEPPADRYWKAADVALSASSPWTVAVHPTALLAGGARRGAILALVAGLSISALLALLVYEGQLVRARGVSLLRVDADLRESIDETEREVTEVRELRGALETRVTERTALLRETIEELETFNYSVAHDLRSPMGAVINFAGILDHDYRTVLDAQAKDYLRRISASAAGAVALMNGLLAFSQSGRQELHRCEIDMRDLVEGVRDDLLRDKSSDSSAIEIGELPDAFADPSMMRRVFTNLISNALKFAAAGEPARVEVAGHVEQGECIYFVRDHGVGFDMRYAQKLFGVFERLHSSEEFEGHGVGLAIVSRLVRRHGGRIWAQGAVGKGATFFFSLPNRGSTEVGAYGTPEV
jgi:light-regulated signal transduction histidine kinase (bacteriophytochrome)